MRAALLTGFGGPNMLEVHTDVAVPQPDAGEVLVEVGAAGINNTDIWTREGGYGSPDNPDEVVGWHRVPLRFPRIQGADVAGRIVGLGAGVRPELRGRRVLVDPALYEGDELALAGADLLGSERDGGFAEYMTVPATNAHPMETSLTDAELASFPTAYSTALRMLDRARVGSGETVLIPGASGGVGSALVRLARVRGARVVAIAGVGKCARLRELGAEQVVSRDAADPVHDIRSTVDEVDVVADVVGGEMFPTLLDVLRPFGRYVTAGAIAGPVVGLDLRTAYLKQLELLGSTMATHEQFAELVRGIESGDVPPLLAGTYPLTDIHAAQRDFTAKEFTGKLALVPEK